ncbi:MAG: hypothetical protein WC220_01355 [Pedobacter sp.]|jgi:hypothetical protein
MTHKIFKKALLFALTLLFIEIASAQTVEQVRPKNPKANSELKNIEFEIAEAFKTVAIELKNIDFEKIGKTVEAASRELSRGLENIEVVVADIPVPESPEEPGVLAGTAEKTKVITKTYSVDSKDKLSVNNQYGRVAVSTWAKNEIKVEIEIKAYEASENGAEQLLESVNIAELREGDLISFKTNFEKTSLNFWSRMKNGQEERRGVQVNYQIYMPARNPLDINNRYGKIEIEDFSGPVNIASSYGSFKSGKLDNPANQVKVLYGSASIENFINGNLSVSYGNLTLNQASKLNATIKYGKATIAHLSQGGNFNIAYTGGFKIDEVDRSVKNLNINSSYSGVTLGMDEGADFDFDVTVSYAGFNYNNNRINLVEQFTGTDKPKSWNPTKNYKGQVGKGSDSRIIIKSNYGGVKFL